MTSTPYAVTFFDQQEYQRRPVFYDRDAGCIYVWDTRKAAEAGAEGLYKAEVVPASTLPYAQHPAGPVCRRCGFKHVYADGLCNACFCI